jgi:hypothetical protein
MALFSKPKKAPVLDGLSADTLLARAKDQPDPVVRYAYLARAAQLAPENLRAQRALLMHGRLHLRDPRHLNYSVIKCYLFHAFEHPDDHSAEQQKAMARELFDDPQLLVCLALAGDRDVFMKEYLQEIAAAYIQLFIAGDSRHTPGIMGIVISSKMPKYLANPSRDVINNILSSQNLNEDERHMLACAFYRAFTAFVGGSVERLDELLGGETVMSIQ